MSSKKSENTDKRIFLTPRYIADTGLASQRLIQGMCADGTIDAVRFGGTWRIRRDEFNRQFSTNI